MSKVLNFKSPSLHLRGPRALKKKKVSFPFTPTLAYYDVDEDSKLTPTPGQKWRSLDEIDRHSKEMGSAKDKWFRNPVWFKGGKKRKSHSRRRSSRKRQSLSRKRKTSKKSVRKSRH